MEPKEIRKQRTLIYFIEATQALIEEDGIDNLTIRKIAARAGYNSATLYHYFDNLNQLITYASLKHISLYNREFAQSVTDDMTEREKFILMWDIFIQHTVLHPHAFASIFMHRPNSGELAEIFTQYNELFPEDAMPPSGAVYTFDQYASLTERNMIVIERIRQEEGKISPRVNEINLSMVYSYLGFTNELLSATAAEKSSLEKDILSCIHFLSDLL